MANLTGCVFDLYDDAGGEVLRSVVSGPGDVPDFVKEAHYITSEDSRPDDNYALVLLNEGQKLRKYATIDAGNTALSVIYLIKQGSALPEKAIKVAASNLIEACNRYQLGVPEQLKEAARTGVISGVSGESQDAYLHKALNKVLEKKTDYPVPEPKGEATMNPQLGKGGTEHDVHKRTNYHGVDGSNFLEAPPFSLKERFGNQEGTGIDREKLANAKAVAEHPGLVESFDLPEGMQAQVKEQSWRTSPYVDVQDWEPGAEKTASAPSRTLLRGRFRVDSFGQVKTAEVYFGENIRQFHPRDRRSYCQKLAARMDELGIPVTGHIAKYASEGYGVEADSYINYRRGFVQEEYHPALDLLLEKRASVDPETFAEALCEFDNMTNLNFQWDSQIPDPWASTFGPSHEKLAADTWTYDENGVRIDECDLKNLARNGKAFLVKSFGEDYAEEFCKNPKTFFNALPTPNKQIVGRMAMDRHSGTGTE